MNRQYVFSLLVILILLVITHYQTHNLQNLLSGFWEADSSFCSAAGLDIFCLYLDDNYSVGFNRPCYILAMQNGDLTLNEPTSVTISSMWTKWQNWMPSLTLPKYFNVTFDNISTDFVDVFPQSQQMVFYPIYGKLVLYYGDTVTAILYKNPINTELKKNESGKK